MKNALTTFQILVRATGTVMLILGLLYWGGVDPSHNLIKIHILMGGLLVLSLWGLAFLAVRTRVSTGLVVLTFAWSLVLPTLGLTQAKFLISPAHWVVQVFHLLVGIGVLGQAEILGGRIKTNLEEVTKTNKRPTRRVRVND
jgi:hypothetical protein